MNPILIFSAGHIALLLMSVYVLYMKNMFRLGISALTRLSLALVPSLVLGYFFYLILGLYTYDRMPAGHWLVVLFIPSNLISILSILLISIISAVFGIFSKNRMRSAGTDWIAAIAVILIAFGNLFIFGAGT